MTQINQAPSQNNRNFILRLVHNIASAFGILKNDFKSFSWQKIRLHSFSRFLNDQFNISLNTPLAVSLLASILFASVIFLDKLAALAAKNIDINTRYLFNEITKLGSADWLIKTSLFIIFSTILLNALFHNRKIRYILTLVRQWAWYILSVVTIAGLSVSLLKHALGRARPKLIEQEGVLGFDFLAFETDFASFPSGHATTAIAAAFALSFLFKRARPILITIGCWVALSRVMVGAHYPADIIAGFVYGSFSAWLMREWFWGQKYFRPLTKKRREIIRTLIKNPNYTSTP